MERGKKAKEDWRDTLLSYPSSMCPAGNHSNKVNYVGCILDLFSPNGRKHGRSIV